MSDEALDARRLPPRSQEDLRRRVVTAVNNGLSQRAAARQFGVSRQAVGDWMGRYRYGGMSALVSPPRGRKPGQKRALAPTQEEEIAQTVLDHHPDEVGLDGFLWTRALIGELMRRRFGVALTPKGVGKYLHRWGFSWQKPLTRAYEQDPAAVQAWLQQTYPAIARQARKEKAVVLWADQTGLRADHVTGRTWGRVGTTPVVRTTGGRFGLSVMAAISNKGHLYFTVYTGTLDAAFFCRFLQRLSRAAGRKVHLIVDRHTAHVARATRQWLAQRTDAIELHYLPGYAPELNPAEVFNGDLKDQVLGGTRPTDFDELNFTTRSVLHRIQKLPRRIVSYFHKPAIRYAAG